MTTATRWDKDTSWNLSVAAEFAPVGPAKDRWSDIPDADWQRVYGISVDQAYGTVQGYADGTFQPAESLTRAHCAKMIVEGLGAARLHPTVPTFSDVLTSHPQYEWIEGGCPAEVVNGYTDGTFRPGNSVLPQQFNSMLARVLRRRDRSPGRHQGANGNLYETIEAWYVAEGTQMLAPFADAGNVCQDHKANTAYLIFEGVLQDGQREGARYLDPLTTLKRVQAAVMIVRAGLVLEGF